MVPTEPPSSCSSPVAPPDGPSGPWANRTVVGAGVTSALGDLCYETATVLLPGFLAVLGLAQARPWDDAAGPFRLVLGLSVIPGALAVLAFLTLVRYPEHAPNPALRFWRTLRGLPARFGRYLGAVGVFGTGDFSHTLLILAATMLLTDTLGVVPAAQAAGLLYVLRNLVQVAAAYPIGALADRTGPGPVLIAGYALGATTAILTALAFWLRLDTIALLAVAFVAAGLYVAVQETLEPTVTAGLVEPETLATSYGALGTVNGVTKLVASAFVGIVWTALSPVWAFGLAAALMAAGTLAMVRVGIGVR